MPRPLRYLSILLGELGDLPLGLGHVVPQQEGAGRAPVLQQRGEGVGVPREHPEAMPLRDTEGSETRRQQCHPAMCQEVLVAQLGTGTVPAAPARCRSAAAAG